MLLKPFRIAPLIGQKHYERLFDGLKDCLQMSYRSQNVNSMIFPSPGHKKYHYTVEYISVIFCGGALSSQIFSTQLYRNNEMLCHFNNTFPRNNQMLYR